MDMELTGPSVSEKTKSCQGTSGGQSFNHIENYAESVFPTPQILGSQSRCHAPLLRNNHSHLGEASKLRLDSQFIHKTLVGIKM